MPFSGDRQGGISLKRSSRRQVAELAGVSEATVSRVFNTPEIVNPAKVALVRSAAERLGYRPDKFASALRRRGTGRLIFLEYRRETGYQWPRIRIFSWLYAQIVRTVVEAVGSTPYHLELRAVDDPDQIAAIGGECDGILAFNVEDEVYAAAVAAAGVPYICAHHTEGLTGYVRCSTDNRLGGRLLGEALARRGDRRVAYVTGHLAQVEAHRLRRDGFREGFGGDVVELEGEIGIEGGMRAAEQTAREIRRGAITALSGVNDLTALGIIRGLTAAGIRVPVDCMVTGYDNLPVGLGYDFTIPSVDLRLDLLYRRAVEALIDSIRDGRPVDIGVAPVLVPGALLDPSEG